MKPLVNYCRWQSLKLRLRGRDDTAVWGQLIALDGTQEKSQLFRYNFKNREITLEGEGRIQLDEMGVVLNQTE